MIGHISQWYENRPVGRRIAELTATGIFCVSIITAALYANSVTSQTAKEYESSLGRQATAATNNIESKIQDYNNLLIAATALFEQKPELNQADWQKYYTDIEASQRFPAVIGIGYTERVDRDSIGAIEQRQHESGLVDFTYRADKDTTVDPYTTITYLAPDNTANRKAMGYDMYSQADRRLAMEEARDKATFVMSKPVSLVQDNGENTIKPGVLIYYPRYSGEGVPATVEERRNRLLGYVYIVSKPDIFISKYLANSEALNISSSLLVYDKEAADKFLYKSTNYDESRTNAKFLTREVELDSRRWVAKIEGDYKGPAILSNPWVMLALGSIFGGILSAIVFYVLEKRLSKVEEKYENEVQRSKDELLALASHQLRTPASGVKQYIGMLTAGIAGELTPMQKSIAEKAFDTNERQLQIINELLYVSKIDAGQLLIEPRTVDVTSTIQRAVDDLADSASQKEIAIVFRNKKPVDIIADSRYVLMIIENLVSNAIKYSYPSSTIRVSMKVTETKVFVHVKDTGVGIPADKYEQVFGKFNRIDNPLSYSEGGSGLGLFLARQLARAHGGDITLESKLEKGSTFTLTLPKSLTLDSAIVNLTNMMGDE